MFYLFPFLIRGVRYLWAQRRLTAPIMVIASGVLAVYIGGTSNTGALFRWTAQVMPYFLLAISFAAFARRRSILARFATWSVLAFSRPRRIAVAY
jgi:hypothetical protein